MFRHAATDQSMPDKDPVDLDDCATQRNLSGAGRSDARAIGAAFRALRIPVGVVWASPYCRAQETAKLSFGRAEVVGGLERLYPRRDATADQRLNQLIRAQAPANGDRNLVIAGHGVYPSALAPAVTLDEGEAAVYSLRGDDVTLLGTVDPGEWAGLQPRRGSTAARPRARGTMPAGAARAAADRALSSVVAIAPPGRGVSGSGFRVGVDRIVVTSAAAVGDAERVTVVLRDGSRQPARVLGHARAFDIAALELTGDDGIAPLHSGSGLAALRPGDEILAVGAPGRVAAGVVRALRRSVRVRGGPPLDALQTDIAIDQTIAGGPLLDSRGDVVGMSTTVATARDAAVAGSGFAIPVDVARREALAIVEDE
ncbi:MAG: trypsin-like peptidase domain-containing protein [Actinomycetota bacterium]|nr:trypsin-like peptidase domain-containing protein [Actinomycetota bacterium]